MSNRRLFLKNALLGLAASLVPRILQPVVPEIQKEEMVDIEVQMNCYVVGTDPYSFEYKETKTHVMKINKKSYGWAARYIFRPNQQL